MLFGSKQAQRRPLSSESNQVRKKYLPCESKESMKRKSLLCESKQAQSKSLPCGSKASTEEAFSLWIEGKPRGSLCLVDQRQAEGSQSPIEAWEIKANLKEIKVQSKLGKSK